MELRDIQTAIAQGHFKVTDHADEEATDDKLILDDILESVQNGEIIEDYPDDQPYPSCLIFGRNKDQDEIHSVWAYNQNTKWAVLITVYRPDPDRWIDWRRRIEDG